MKKILLTVKRITIYLAKWSGLSLAMGLICGVLGTFFASLIHGATELRMQYPLILLGLPLAGLLSVGLYRLCRVEGIGTVRVMQSAVRKRRVSSLLAPAIFGGTVLTHLFGGSAGKEGAALQLGGSLAAWLSKILHLSEDDQHTLVSAGMGAFFSALFGTPLGAFIFVLEVLRQGRQCLKAAFPSLMASLIGFFTAGLCGMEWERFSFSVPALSWSIAWKGTVVAAIGGLIALVFCVCLHLGEDLAKKIVKNDYLRIAFGGLLILGLTAWVGSMEYNGGGMQVVERVFEGSVRYEAFALKMLFTILTVSAGFKGGEIVPSIFIGATLGGALAGALGLPIGFAAALGMIAVLGGVTNCPLAFSFVALEMFNGQGFGYMIVAAFLGYAFSFPVSLYSKIKKD